MSGIIGGAGSKSGVIGTTEIDYEEGTFTAELRGQGGRATTPVLLTDAEYIKVGKLVHITCAFDNVNTGGASGQIQVTGLPFANNNSLNVSAADICLCNKLTFPDGAVPAMVVSGTTLYGNTLDHSGTSADWAMVGTTAVYLRIQATYKTP